MSTSDTGKLERLNALEKKIAEAAESAEELTERCRKLTRVNQELEQQVAKLLDTNQALTQDLEKLRAAPTNGSDPEKEKKILRKIDRMIEKFGELQV